MHSGVKVKSLCAAEGTVIGTWTILQWKWKWKWSRSVVSDSSRPHGVQPTRLLHPWDFPGKRTGVGCHCLLWQIPTNSKQKLQAELLTPPPQAPAGPACPVLAAVAVHSEDAPDVKLHHPKKKTAGNVHSPPPYTRHHQIWGNKTPVLLPRGRTYSEPNCPVMFWASLTSHPALLLPSLLPHSQNPS